MNKVKIQELSTPGCSHCAAAKEILENEIKPNFPDVEIEYVDLLSDKGREVIVRYGVMSSPGIIINDELFSVGGLDKDKLVARIKRLSS